MFFTWNFVLRLISLIQDTKSFLLLTSLSLFMTSSFLSICRKFEMKGGILFSTLKAYHAFKLNDFQLSCN